ncbi:unnamed protein product [Blepharisma stoltei]|uniref:Uncharacterized protein n=1 Tax=Blepharisma stoltei TaxID=1481888 RepID=A0AAU9J1F5_9CILI|nr:unnamed protein product [Blepharisma stoltei]
MGNSLCCQDVGRFVEANNDIVIYKGSDLRDIYALYHQRMNDETRVLYKQVIRGNADAIERIQIISADLDDPESRFLGFILAELFNLQKLILKENKLSFNGLMNITVGLENCYELKVLVISSNRIGKDELKVLCESISSLKKLEKIELADNDLNDEDMNILMKTLSDFSALKSLDIHKNNISYRGLYPLASVLKNLSAFEELSLSANDLTHDEIGKITTLIPKINIINT